MFAEFLNIIVRSLKLDKTLYKDNRNFGEAAIYFAGLIIILGGIGGAIAANTVIKMVNIWPSRESIPIKRLNATKFKPDAFNINSTPINIATAFLRVMTPNTPNENRIELIARYEYKLSISNPS